MAGKILKVGVIGSRTITNKSLIYKALDAFATRASLQKDQIVVLSGGAKGVDTLAQEWCREREVPFILFKPYFLVDNKAAYNPRHYFTRNKQIIDNSDTILAFWDGETKGTSWGISYSRKQRKAITVIDAEYHKHDIDAS